MDVDFSLILVVLTGAALVLWLVDRSLFAPRRQAEREQLASRFPRWQTPGSEDARGLAAQLLASGAPRSDSGKGEALRPETLVSDPGALGEALRQYPRQPMPFEYAQSFLPVLLIVLVLRSFVVEPFQIPSASMVPTLEVGDFIAVNKFAYGLRLPVLKTKILPLGEPQRGDVMVFFPPNDSRYFIKRVIGLPGDRIEIRDKVVSVNGVEAHQSLLAELPPGKPTYQLLEERLSEVSHEIRTEIYKPRARTPLGYDPDNLTLTVEPGHYFMMGDNRDNSSDSRFWGLVPEKNIVGRAFAIWMHWDAFFSLPSFSRVGSIE